MKKYSVMVDAQLDGCKSEMVLFSQSYETCPFSARHTIYQWLCRNFPLISWTPDDGDDFDEDPNTDYCQYVAYCDASAPDSYLLFSFNVVSEGGDHE